MDAVEEAFGADVDFGVLQKMYEGDDRIASLCLERAAHTNERLVDRSLVRDLLKAQAA